MKNRKSSNTSSGQQGWLFCVCIGFLLFCIPSPLWALRATQLAAGESQEHVKWIGDYDKMVEDRVVRVLIPYSKTFYFLDGATEKGLSYETAKAFEKFINKRHKTKHLKIMVMIIPTERNELFSNLLEGYGDIAMGNLTITEKRLEQVAFSDPFFTDVDEIVVAAKNGPELKSVFDLSGKEVYVRRSSSYYESLLKLNEVLSSVGKEPVKITRADEHLEDEDLLEMLAAGVVPLLIVDKHKARFWEKILDGIRLYPDVAVNTGGKIGWAFRKESPELEKVINEFVKKHKKGTLSGNMAFNKYLKSQRYITNPASQQERENFKRLVGYFKKYAQKYNFNYLMLTALAYQESHLNQNARSHVGAVGVMQILPSTAKDKNVNIPNIDEVEANIHAGTKYLRFMVDRYFADEKISKLNRGLFAFAAYNAGPAKVTRMRKAAEKMGLNPNVWFKNVEVVAAKQIGRETVQYVSNIYKYYVVYTILAEKGKL